MCLLCYSWGQRERTRQRQTFRSVFDFNKNSTAPFWVKSDLWIVMVHGFLKKKKKTPRLLQILQDKAYFFQTFPALARPYFFQTPRTLHEPWTINLTFARGSVWNESVVLPQYLYSGTSDKRPPWCQVTHSSFKTAFSGCISMYASPEPKTPPPPTFEDIFFCMCVRVNKPSTKDHPSYEITLAGFVF